MKIIAVVLVSALAAACTYKMRELEPSDAGDSVPGTDGVQPGDEDVGDDDGGGGDTKGGDSSLGDSDCPGICAACPMFHVRQHTAGETDCCGTCITTHSCVSPPTKCTQDSDCPDPQECVMPYKVCGTPDSGSTAVFVDGGRSCSTKVCSHGEAVYYYGDGCCPGCAVMCGGAPCDIEACHGTSCQCDTGEVCTTNLCECAN